MSAFQVANNSHVTRLRVMLLTHFTSSSSQPEASDATTAPCVSPPKHPAVRYRAPKTPGTTTVQPGRSTHITWGISRAINNCHRNRGSNVCRRRRNRFRREERSGGGGSAVQSLSSDSTSASIRLPRMNSRVHVRAVRAGVSLYKTAVLFRRASSVFCAA